MLNRRLVVFLLLAITAAGGFLRLHDLTQKSLWDDEIFSLNALGIYRLQQTVPDLGTVTENVIRYYRADNHPPLFFILLGIWLRLFGVTEFAVRLFSALASVLTIPVVYLLSMQIFKDRKISLVSAALFSGSAFIIYYAQEARMYSLLLLLACLSMLFFLRSQQGGRWGSYAGFALFSVLGLYTHYYFFFLLFFQIVYWLASGDERFQAFVLSLSSIFLAFVPWLPVLLYQVTQKHQSDLWIRSSARGWDAAGEAAVHWTYVLFRFMAGENFIFPNTAWGLRAMLWILALAGVLALLQRPFLFGTKAGRFLALWLAIPIGCGFAADLLFKTKTLEMSKYFIVSYPALLLIMAASVVRFPWKPAAWVLLPMFLFLNAKSLLVYYNTSKAVEWREVSRYLSDQIGSDDILLSPEPKVMLCVGFYLERRIRAIEVPFDANTDYILGAMQRGAAASNRIWMVSIYESFSPKLQMLNDRLSCDYLLLSEEPVCHHAVVRSFVNLASQRAKNLPAGIKGARDAVAGS